MAGKSFTDVHFRGVLKIAEVKSRFVDVEKFNADVSSLGFSLLHQVSFG